MTNELAVELLQSAIAGLEVNEAIPEPVKLALKNLLDEAVATYSTENVSDDQITAVKKKLALFSGWIVDKKVKEYVGINIDNLLESLV